MTDLAILVPVLRRPQNVAPLVASIDRTTPPARVLFLADPGDTAEHEAIHDAGAEMLVVDGNYARKITYGVWNTSESLVFTAADDLEFRSGWLDAARAGLDSGARVVGVNDLIERRPSRVGHATHFLMTRDYAEQPTIDGGHGPFHHGYDHSFCDDELIATATYRGVYAYCDQAHVKHSHPMAGGPDDETYRKGRAKFQHDRRIYQRRARLWK